MMRKPGSGAAMPQWNRPLAPVNDTAAAVSRYRGVSPVNMCVDGGGCVRCIVDG